jgi:hypothetical protein
VLGGSIQCEKGAEAGAKAENRKTTSPVSRLSGFPPYGGPGGASRSPAWTNK